jgi:SAM-dependent methyltransferase
MIMQGAAVQPDHPARVGRHPAGSSETSAANRRWWDAAADDYQAEHGAFLGGPGNARFIWGPEGLDEATAHILGPTASLSGCDVLEIGCGAAQCGRWLASLGASVLAFDLSRRQLRHAQLPPPEVRPGRGRIALLQADAEHLPLAGESFDVAFSAYGAFPFVADAIGALREVARVLRPGGRLAFSVTHPIRWAFPDDPGVGGLTVRSSYFDRTPYVETDADGGAAYVEHHRTMGDWVGAINAAGFVLTDLVEPEWPDAFAQPWGGWSPLRGALIPGTAIFRANKPGG